jgi:hypothetical protein
MFIMLLGRLGTHAVSVSTLAFNVNSVAFVPLIGLGMAVTTLVGQQLGGDRPDRAARAAWTGFHMGAPTSLPRFATRPSSYFVSSRVIAYSTPSTSFSPARSRERATCGLSSW